MAKMEAKVEVQIVNAAEVSAIMYEIAGHFGKLGHLYSKLAEMADKANAERTNDNEATPTG